MWDPWCLRLGVSVSSSAASGLFAGPWTRSFLIPSRSHSFLCWTLLLKLGVSATSKTSSIWLFPSTWSSDAPGALYCLLALGNSFDLTPCAFARWALDISVSICSQTGARSARVYLQLWSRLYRRTSVTVFVVTIYNSLKPNASCWALDFYWSREPCLSFHFTGVTNGEQSHHCAVFGSGYLQGEEGTARKICILKTKKALPAVHFRSTARCLRFCKSD